MRLSELAHPHAPEAVASRPAPRREAARMLCVGADASLCHRHVADLPLLVEPGEVLVLNDTRVRPTRLRGRKPSGGAVEMLVLEPAGEARWRALLRASRAPRSGSAIELPGGGIATVVGRDGAAFLIEVDCDLEACLERHGEPPLPPYIGRAFEEEDRARYQTLHARSEPQPLGTAGAAVAAPTAGLHLTPRLLREVEARGAQVVRVSLGVGAGTFRPVQEQRVEDHRMHEEAIELSGDAARTVDRALREGRRVTAVGTTTLRALEAAATPGGRVRALRARTGLFITPGTRLRTASRLLTNFHQPGSSLLALVRAFAGGRAVDAAHREAAAAGYRLFSYGDCSLLERRG